MAKSYVGQINFKISGKQLQQFIKEEVARALNYERRRLEDEIKAIRNLQTRMDKVEMKQSTKELRKKIK